MKTRHIASAALIALLLGGCASHKDIQYIQDIDESYTESISPNTGITIEPGDRLSIIVTSKDTELSSMFNMQPGITTYAEGVTTSNNMNQLQQADLGYRVDSDGNIIFPILGQLHVAGMNRVQVENLIKQRIIKEGLLKDFSVRVSFLNFRVSVLGDVGRLGNYNITDDRFNLMQLLAEVGGTNVTAEIEDVLVIREKKGQRKVYKVNLKSKDIFNSPAYYLQQNDIVYVIPNDRKAADRDANTRTFQTVGFWTGMFSFAASIATMIIALSKN